MSEYQDDLVENFEQLREERGWSEKVMGDYIEARDPSLAAEYRKAHAAKAPGKRAEAPKGRRSAVKDEA